MENTRKTTAEEKEVLEYLNELRESGQTNMFAATPFIAEEFGISKQDAQKHLSLWMKNYNEEGNYDMVKAD